MQRRSVLLPEPDGPMMQETVPVGTVRLTPFRTSSVPKDFRTARAKTIASAGTPNRRRFSSFDVTSRPCAPEGQSTVQNTGERIVVPPVAASVIAFEKMLADRHYGDDEEIPERHYYQQRNGLECPGVDALRRVEEIIDRDEGDDEVIFRRLMASLPVGGTIKLIACGRTMRHRMLR
jgi:hypothetical protein